MNEDDYFVIRAYDSLEQMHADQDAFYSSDAWRSGPRQPVIDLIEDSMEVVLELSSDAVDAFRDGFKVS